MVGYKEYEKKVYDWLMDKHKDDNSFTFSVRQKGSKGSELDYFIGTEKSNYFSTTFWTIPVNFPGSSGDCSGLQFRYTKTGYTYFFEFTQTRNPKPGQNTFVLNLVNSLINPLEKMLGLKRELSDDTKMLTLRTNPRQNSYESFEAMFADIEKDMEVILPLVDEYILKEKEINATFEAHRISENLFDLMQQKMEVRFIKYSIAGNTKEIKYWLYSPGENAYKWQDFYNKGIVAIGWDALGDLKNYKSKNEIKDTLFNAYGGEGDKKNDVSANDEFANKMEIGDIIIVKRGRGELLGYGEVLSEYYFEAGDVDYRSRRDVDWKLKGNWKVDHSLVLKTLTDITNYKTEEPNYSKYSEKLLAIMATATEDNNEKELERNSTTLNQILYGPPGTGKTYNTINKALAIIENKTEDEIKSEKRKDLKERFDQYIKNGQIVFTTFHQSMSYEDFVEGIKPKIDEGDDESKQVIYEVEDGIFKRLVENAKKSKTESSTLIEQYSFEDAWDDLVGDSNKHLEENSPLFLAIQTPNLGLKIVDVSERGNLKLKPIYSENAKEYTVSYTRVKKLHEVFPDLSVIKNIDKEFRAVIGGSNSTAYWAVLNYISQRINEKTKTSSKEVLLPALPHVLIIDEINRGNVSQIFGELITLIEDSKRLGEDESLVVELPYSKKKFGVPSNVHIIGTMNTADRSVEALDTALRRRFSFTEMMPEYDSLYNINFDGFNMGAVLQKINQRIETLLDRDRTIGHSYFINLKSGDTEALKVTFFNKIIPLLQEYFYHDYEKMGWVLGQEFIEEVKGNKNDIFGSFYNVQQPDVETTYKLRDFKTLDILKAVEGLLGIKKTVTHPEYN